MNESPRWCIVLFHQPSAPYRCDHLRWVGFPIFEPNDDLQSCVRFPNQIKIVTEIHWSTRLHVVNHWVPIHSEGKNIYNHLNDVYRPQGHQESDRHGLQLCFCHRALCIGASDIALLCDPSSCRIYKKDFVAYNHDPGICWVSCISQQIVTT